MSANQLPVDPCPSVVLQGQKSEEISTRMDTPKVISDDSRTASEALTDPRVIQHAPLPWQQSHREKADGYWSTEVYDSAGEAICSVSWYPVDLGNGVIGTARGANAEFIVTACNSHDALIAALSQLVRAIKFTSGVSLEFATKDAEAAIAKAEAPHVSA